MSTSKIYLMTDLEGVAGVLDSENWCLISGKYYELAKELLTLEVNAAVSGFFEGGATEILVSDGHGCGGIAVNLLDPRVDYLRGWPEGWPLNLDSTFETVAWIGQHAKAGTEYAHLAHTQSMEYIDLSVNGTSIGEFGQLGMCASELGVRSIFGSGDEAFTKEAKALVPGIETVSVKRGLTPGKGDELPADAYRCRNTAAIHIPPERARALIREGAKRAVERARAEDFGLIRMSPPYERTVVLRPNAVSPKRVARDSHESSFIALMNLALKPAPIAG